MKNNDLSHKFASLLTASLFLTSTGFTEEAVAPATEKKTEAAEVVVKEEGGNLFSFEMYVDFYSAYVWRGMVLTEEPV